MKPINTTLISQQIDRIADSLPQYRSLLTMPDYEQGLLGMSLFYCFLARYTSDDRHYQTAEASFDEALTLMGPGHFVKRFRQDYVCNDLMSLGRYIEYSVLNGFLEIDTNIFLAQADEIVQDTISRRARFGDLDLFGGVLHGGHYFHARLGSNPKARTTLEEVVDHIARLTQYDPDGRAFWTSPTLKNAVYFGMSHGSGMILSFLAAMHELGIRIETCGRLMLAGVDFVLKHQRNQPLGLFPLVLGDEVESKQFSQCYGDLGTSYGLFRASQVMPDHTLLQQRSREVLIDCCSRTQADGCTPDATITYGAAGLAAVFDKLHRLSGDPLFEATANTWYEAILAYARPEGTYGGFHNRFDGSHNEFMQVSFGWGIIGTGIALMQYQDKSLPSLDGLIMTI